MAVTALTIALYLGISGVLMRRQAASLFAEHESRIEEGAKRDTVLAELQQDRRSTARELVAMRVLMAIAATGTLSLALAFVWRRRVSRPIELISDQMHKMRRGTWSHPIPVEHDDEIGTLMREFNGLGPELSFTAHQYAAASKLSAMALIGQRVVRRTMAARQRLLAVSELLERLPNEQQFRSTVAEQVRLVAGDLESVSADFDAEFEAELVRVGSTGPCRSRRAATQPPPIALPERKSGPEETGSSLVNSERTS